MKRIKLIHTVEGSQNSYSLLLPFHDKYYTYLPQGFWLLEKKKKKRYFADTFTYLVAKGENNGITFWSLSNLQLTEEKDHRALETNNRTRSLHNQDAGTDGLFTGYLQYLQVIYNNL